MAENVTVELTSETYAQITSGDASGNTTCVLLNGEVELMATTSASAPAATVDGLPLWRIGDGWTAETLTDMFSVTSAVRLYGRKLPGSTATARVKFISV